MLEDVSPLIEAKIKCKEDNCFKKVAHKELCNHHYFKMRVKGKICQEQGCKKELMAKNLCRTHYLALLYKGKVCSENICNTHIYQRGLCHAHYSSLRKITAPFCKIVECDKKSIHRSLCRKHYDESRYAGKECSFPGCETIVSIIPFCYRHENQLRRMNKSCLIEKCIRKVHRANLCPKHYRERMNMGKKCNAPKCESNIHVAGLCGPHYVNGVNYKVGSSYGPQVLEPATLYLLYSEGFSAYKIGWTKLNSTRISRHNSKGWNLISKWDFELGRDALKVEQIILNQLEHKEVVPQNKMSQGGFTETFNLDLFSEEELICKIEESIKMVVGVSDVI